MLKQNYRIFLIFLLAYTVCGAPAQAVPALSAQSAILMDAASGQVLYEHKARELRPPASTTKILTVIMAIEKGNLDQEVEISCNAANTGEATIGLNKGDRITVRNLIHGALLRSGNDACVALSEYIAPSEEEFVGLMNLKALTLGAYDTKFYNTNGLPHSKHLTTAYDLAVITRYALTNEFFCEVVAKKDYVLEWAAPSRRRYIANTNKLLWNYPYATGVKTGTTDSAGRCLVASAVRQGKKMVAVVLNSSRRFDDATRLLEYGFNQIIQEGEQDAQKRYR